MKRLTINAIISNIFIACVEITKEQLNNIKDDPELFILVYKKYMTEIYGYAVYLTRNQHDAEDVTSKTFLKALEKISSFTGEPGKLRSWLYTIARNTFLDSIRKNKKEIVDVEILSYQHDPLDLAHSQEQSIEIQELIAHINKLKPEIYKEVLILKYQKELSHAEIASIIGKGEDNVRVLVHRAMTKLKKLL